MTREYKFWNGYLASGDSFWSTGPSGTAGIREKEAIGVSGRSLAKFEAAKVPPLGTREGDITANNEIMISSGGFRPYSGHTRCSAGTP